MSSNDKVRRQVAVALTGLLIVWGGVGVGARLLVARSLALVVEPARRDGVAGLAVLPFEDALQGLCAAVLVACVGWLLLSGTIAVAAHLVAEVAPRSRSVRVLRRVNERTCPRPVRRLVAATLGVALSTGLTAVPAHGAPLRAADPVSDLVRDPVGEAVSVPGQRLVTSERPALLRAGLTGLAVPDRAVDTGRSPARAAPLRLGGHAGHASHAGEAGSPRRVAPRASSVLVEPGQCLWSIAEDLLTRQRSDGRTDQTTGTPTDQDVTAAWHRLHRLNAGRIGPDPDLLLPGTRLVVPDLTVPHREEAP